MTSLSDTIAEEMDARIAEKLRAAQKPIERYLWVPSDAITFTPAVLTRSFGDGRALFGFSTVNNRPAYWIVRGCSSWALDLDYKAPSSAPDFAEFCFDVMGEIEDEFGSADHYEYCWKADRWRDRDTFEFVPNAWVEYPALDPENGCHWFRLDWPTGFDTEPHPFARASIAALTALDKEGE